MTEALPVARPTGQLVTLAGTLQELVDAQRAYRAACAELLDPSDFVEIEGELVKTRSAWDKLAVAFGISVDLRSMEVERNEVGRIQRATAVVRVSHPAGREQDGIGVCDFDERRWAHAEHDIVATAFTRASNRAKADLFGLGEASAEEGGRDEAPARRQSARRGEPGWVRDAP